MPESGGLSAFCDQITEVRFEHMRAGTLEYIPQARVTKPADLAAFCRSIRAFPVGSETGPPRSKPWGWIGFFAGEKLVGSVTIQHQGEAGYFIATGGSEGSVSRRLSKEETGSLVRLMSDTARAESR